MGIDISDPSRIDSKVYAIFSRAECDSSGCLRRDQFAVVCRNDRRIRKLLAANGKPNNESWSDLQWWTHSSQRKRWCVVEQPFLLCLLLLWHLWSTEQHSFSRLFVYYSALVYRVYVFDYLSCWSRNQQSRVAHRMIDDDRFSLLTSVNVFFHQCRLELPSCHWASLMDFDLTSARHCHAEENSIAITRRPGWLTVNESEMNSKTRQISIEINAHSCSRLVFQVLVSWHDLKQENERKKKREESNQCSSASIYEAEGANSFRRYSSDKQPEMNSSFESFPSPLTSIFEKICSTFISGEFAPLRSSPRRSKIAFEDKRKGGMQACDRHPSLTSMIFFISFFSMKPLRSMSNREIKALNKNQDAIDRCTDHTW